MNNQPKFLVMRSVKYLGGPAQRGAHPSWKRVVWRPALKRQHLTCLQKDKEDSPQRGQVKEAEDIPGRGQNMSKAERHESAGYF